MKVLDAIATQASSIAAIRRDIHAHPELCFEEIRTADLVAQKLTEWGIPIHRGMGKTGVVGILKCGTGERADRAIGLRADMDALPMQEFNHFAHASQHAGKMHACGHDGHVAMLLAAAATPPCRTPDSTRCRWRVRWCRRSRPSSAATRNRSMPA